MFAIARSSVLFLRLGSVEPFLLWFMLNNCLELIALEYFSFYDFILSAFHNKSTLPVFIIRLLRFLAFLFVVLLIILFVKVLQLGFYHCLICFQKRLFFNLISLCLKFRISKQKHSALCETYSNIC
jgi:hypothetical protein